MAATKRRIRFRFGFSDKAALQAGETGPACRGEEHEVMLVWSLVSGKKIVTMDEQVLHSSCGGKLTQNRFEASWSLGYHTVKIIAHAAPPVRNVPGLRQFDLLLDGLSFFDFVKLFELGTKKGKQRSNLSVSRITENINDSSSYNLPSSVAQKSTLEDTRDSSGTAVSSSFKPTPSPIRPVVDSMSSEPSPQHDFLDSGPSESCGTPTNDEFAPQTAALEPVSFATLTNHIMSTYAPAPAPASPPVLALANESHTYGFHGTADPSFVAPQFQYSNNLLAPQKQSYYGQSQSRQQTLPYNQQQVSPSIAAVSSNYNLADTNPFGYFRTPTMEPLSIGELDECVQAPELLSPLDKAVRSLVHLDDISESVETPEQRKFQQQKLTKQPVQSQPLPPTNADWKLGSHARLGDIKRNAPVKAEPKQGIMRTQIFDPSTAQGVMVVHGDVTTVAAQQPSIAFHHQQYHHHHQNYTPQQQQQRVGFYPQQQAQRMF